MKIGVLSLIALGLALSGCNRSGSPKPGSPDAPGAAAGTAQNYPNNGPASVNPGGGGSFTGTNAGKANVQR